jgi:hypothetical protein
LSWGALLGLSLFFVSEFGPDFPMWDDYTVVPQSLGKVPITLSWLWSQDSEHRIPIQRLLLISLFHLGEANPRPAMFFTVGLLGVLTATLLLAARKARGSWQYADAFLSLVLLNLGHHEIFLWAFCVGYALITAFLGFVLAVIVRSGGVPRPAAVSLAILSVTLLPLCNGGGVLFTPAMIIWLLYLALSTWRSKTPGSHAKGLLILLCSLPAVCMLVFYFQGFVRPKLGPPGSLWDAGRTVIQSLSMSLGYPATVLWPWPAIAVSAILAGALLILAIAWFREPDRRVQIAGLACVLLSVLTMALGLGWARSGQGERAGFQNRYTLAAVPALLGGYFTFATFGPRISRHVAPMILFTGACILLWPNLQDGWAAGHNLRLGVAAFERDLAAGMPPFRLVRRYSPLIHPSQERLQQSLKLLHRAGIGRFRSLQPDPLFEERKLNLKPAEVRLARWNEGAVEVTGVDPWIRFDLTRDVPVCGIRIRYSHASPDGTPARFRLAWRRGGQPDFPTAQQYANWNLPTGPNNTTTVWIDDVVSQIRIQPDNRPCEFTIAELTLLLAPRAQTRTP